MKRAFSSYISNVSGTTNIEYGLIATLIGLGLLTGAELLGSGEGSGATKLTAELSAAHVKASSDNTECQKKKAYNRDRCKPDN